jgi:hypothetical protein
LEDTTVAKGEALISIEDLRSDERQLLIDDVFSMVVLVNFLVVVSIILCG